MRNLLADWSQVSIHWLTVTCIITTMSLKSATILSTKLTISNITRMTFSTSMRRYLNWKKTWRFSWIRQLTLWGFISLPISFPIHRNENSVNLSCCPIFTSVRFTSIESRSTLSISTPQLRPSSIGSINTIKHWKKNTLITKLNLPREKRSRQPSTSQLKEMKTSKSGGTGNKESSTVKK